MFRPMMRNQMQPSLEEVKVLEPKEEKKELGDDFDKEVETTAGDIIMNLSMLGEQKYQNSQLMTFLQGLN